MSESAKVPKSAGDPDMDVAEDEEELRRGRHRALPQAGRELTAMWEHAGRTVARIRRVRA